MLRWQQGLAGEFTATLELSSSPSSPSTSRSLRRSGHPLSVAVAPTPARGGEGPPPPSRPRPHRHHRAHDVRPWRSAARGKCHCPSPVEKTAAVSCGEVSSPTPSRPRCPIVEEKSLHRRPRLHHRPFPHCRPSTDNGCPALVVTGVIQCDTP
jgi:hypothetical protein